jgi:hypothetical protein
MDDHNSYAASALCQDRKKFQKFPASALCEYDGSDTSSSSEPRLEEEDDVEEDNVIVEINSEVESDEDEEVVVSETEDEVVPETQKSLQVVVFET